MQKGLIRAVFAAGVLAAGSMPVQAQTLVTQGVTDSEILFGTHTDLSGPLAGVAGETRDGMLMRIEEINEAGGIRGRKLRLIVEDTGYDTKKAVLATQKLIERDKVFAIVFPFGTGPSLATLPITREKKIPLLFPGSGATAFHTPPTPFSFGYYLPDQFFMRVGIDYAVRELKPKRVGLIYQGDDYGEAVLAGAKESLARHKIELVEAVSYKPGATDFSAQVARLKAANIDLLLLGTALRETAGVARERQKLDWDVKMLGGFPVYNTISVGLARGAMEGTYAVGQNKVFYPDTAPAPVKAFYDKYRGKYGRDPGPTAVSAYMVMSWVADAIDAAGRNLTADGLIQGFYKIKYTGIFETPEVTFTPQRHHPPMKAFVAQVRNGRWEALTPYIGD